MNELQFRLQDADGTEAYAETEEERVLARYLDYQNQEKFFKEAKEELAKQIKQDITENGTVYRVGQAQANVATTDRTSYESATIATLIKTGDISEKVAKAITKTSQVTTLRIGKATS